MFPFLSLSWWLPCNVAGLSLFFLLVPSYQVSVVKIRSVQDLKGRQEREKQNPFFAAPDRNRPSKTDCTAFFVRVQLILLLLSVQMALSSSPCLSCTTKARPYNPSLQGSCLPSVWFLPTSSSWCQVHVPFVSSPWSLPSYTKHCCGPDPFKLLTYTTCCMFLLHFFLVLAQLRLSVIPKI